MNTNFTSRLCLLFYIFLAGCSSAPKFNLPAAENYQSMSICNVETISGKHKLNQHDQAILAGITHITSSEEMALVMKKASHLIATTSGSINDCEKTFAEGEHKFKSSLLSFQKQFMSKSHYQPSDTETWAQIQQQITTLWANDQSARMALVSLLTKDKNGAAYWAQQLAKAHAFKADQKSLNYLQQLLTEIDWIDNKRFGSKVSAHAWILIQHADRKPALQADVLERMKPYLKRGLIKPANYAYLWDRVAVNNNRKQRYGTQPIWVCQNGHLKLAPIENEELVNQRRTEMKMTSVEAGLAQMEASYCP